MSHNATKTVSLLSFISRLSKVVVVLFTHLSLGHQPRFLAIDGQNSITNLQHPIRRGATLDGYNSIACILQETCPKMSQYKSKF